MNQFKSIHNSPFQDTHSHLFLIIDTNGQDRNIIYLSFLYWSYSCVSVSLFFPQVHWDLPLLGNYSASVYLPH